MRKIKELADLGGEIVRVVPAPDGQTYDRVVVLRKEIKVEIQITEPGDFLKYGDVRLDLVSAFQFDDWTFRGRSYIEPFCVYTFLRSIQIMRPGKLYESKAETLAFYVPQPVDLLWLLNMSCLQKNRDTWIQKYGIYINKKRDEDWESCFVAVDSEDKCLDECGIKYQGDFEDARTAGDIGLA